VTLYNPHLLARQELIDTFVAREPLLDELLDDLRRGGRQHHLLVGGRGSGKTTLLLRLAVAIEDDKQLTKRCIPLRFPEEQYNVSRPSDFWMNAIDALADALERQDDRVAAKQLESSLTELEPLEEDRRAKQALAVLEGWAQQTKRLIVLLVDNLGLVLDRLSKSLWALRETLSIDNRLAVIGASSKFLEETIDYQSPFYDFFHVHELGPLSEDEARRVVLALARRVNTPRVADVLARDPGRFKALFVLTGGTPRTLALLHTVLALDHSDRIDRDLDGLLDQLTPYYKARFDDLPSQSQVIVDKVALHWHPITAAECQAATHLDVNTVSAQLNRLVKSGLLAKVSLPGETKLGFQLSERFFNIWYLMRASRRLRRRLSWFVEFLRIFYGEEDLRRRAEELVRAAPRDSLSSPAKFLAFASAVPDEALRRRLEFRAIEILMRERATVIRDAIDLEGEDIHLASVVDRVRALREIRARIVQAKVRWPKGHTANSVAERIAGDAISPIVFKQRLSLSIQNGDIEDIEDIEQPFQIALSPQARSGLGDRLSTAISIGEVPSLADVTTPSEVRQIVDLAESKSRTVSLLLILTEGSGASLSDDAMKALIFSDPSAAEEILLMAAALVARRDWLRIQNLVLLVARQSKVSIPINALFVLFSKCVANNLAMEALSLLEDIGLTERAGPLYEALRAVAEGNKARLDGLAPEMRAVASPLYDLICAPDVALPTSEVPAVVSVLASPKRKGLKRRAARPPLGRPAVRPKRAR
jgi:energy-coupling factor transporter ATP-binding protein EcfA2